MFKALNLPGDFITRQRAASKSPMLAVTSMLPELRQVDVRRVMDGLEASVGNGFYDIPQTADWAELGEMQRNGIIIGSHTRSHVSLPMEAPADIDRELTQSKRVIEQHLGRSCDHFAYPGGQFTPEVVDAVARAGSRFAYTACQHDDPRHRRDTGTAAAVGRVIGRRRRRILVCHSRLPAHHLGRRPGGVPARTRPELVHG